MLIPERHLEILAELGLTQMEAKVYTVLLYLKSATARNVHRESNIARQDVYRILSDLQEKGLIEKVIARPAKFRPISAKDAISTLLQRKIEHNRQLRKKAKQAFSNLEINCVKTEHLDENVNFILLSKSETNPTGHIDRIGKAVDDALKNVMGLITFQLFMKVKLMDESIWKKAVKKGIKFKFIISGNSDEKEKLALHPMLKNTENFKIRWTPKLPHATVLLVDEKEAFCRTGITAESPVLWSTEPSFVAMIKDYLNTKWQALS
jgi:sugar-specific transcriptional regulator TrmB